MRLLVGLYLGRELVDGACDAPVGFKIEVNSSHGCVSLEREYP